MNYALCFSFYIFLHLIFPYSSSQPIFYYNEQDEIISIINKLFNFTDKIIDKEKEIKKKNDEKGFLLAQENVNVDSNMLVKGERENSGVQVKIKLEDDHFKTIQKNGNSDHIFSAKENRLKRNFIRKCNS